MRIARDESIGRWVAIDASGQPAYEWWDGTYPRWMLRSNRLFVPAWSEGTYAPNPDGRYGSRFGDARPPGLPEWARYCEARHGAQRPARDAAEAYGLGPMFVSALSVLLDNESGGQRGRPANIFDARTFRQRPQGQPYITAWGALQWNAGAWVSLAEPLRGTSYPAVAPPWVAYAWPWQCTEEQELEWPIARYAQIWRAMQDAGAGDPDAARGVFLWHSRPALFRAWRNVRATGGSWATFAQENPQDARAADEKTQRAWAI